jgi:hypothetical protein
MHDQKRAKFLSNFCSSLLEWYDRVIYTDVDEFLVPDPAVYTSLRDFTNRTPHSTVTAIGLNLTYLPDIEEPIDTSRPILGQRRWARFSFAMCKPLFTLEPLVWKPGFHSSNQDVMFDHLFLFHFHHFDRSFSLRRLSKTRSTPWGDGRIDHYQRWSDEKSETIANAIANLPRITATTFGDDDPIIGPYLEWMRKFVKENPEQKHLFYFNNGMHCHELLEIPKRFIGSV